MILVLREKNEGLFKLRFIVSFRHLGYHYVQEITVINKNNTFLVFIVSTSLWVVVQIFDQALDFLLCWFETQSSQCHLQVFNVNASGTTGIEEGKCLLNFCLLLLSQFIAVLVPGLFLRTTTRGTGTLFGWKFFDCIRLILVSLDIK